MKEKAIWGYKVVILFDRFNLPGEIFEVVFATEQQVIVAKELMRYMAENSGEIGKTEMSMFAISLHEGKYETVLDKKRVRLSYNKRQFYDRILTPMKSMGLIDYDLYKKTYKLSDKFYNDMVRIGLMWKKALRDHGIKEQPATQ